MNKVYLLIGGNLGDVAATFSNTKKQIELQVGEIITSSSVYKTAAWGLENQPDFLNQVLHVNTDLTAHGVLKIILNIEADLGRMREIKNGPRIIDIDILFFNDEIINTENLRVPHLYLHQRNFTLAPLAEIAPDFFHPVLKRNMLQLLRESTDKLPVVKL